jgi:hypothetical protein
MVYDPTGNQIIVCMSINGSDTHLWLLPVASDGTLGGLASLGSNLDSLGRIWGKYAVVHNATYLVEQYTAYTQSYNISDGSVGVYGGSWNSYGANVAWGTYLARKIGNYLFFANNVAYPGAECVSVVNLATNTLLGQFGPANVVCTGFHINGNTLYFTVGTSLYIYDITATLSSNSMPSPINTVTGLSNAPFGLGGYPDTGWDGNSGGCTS